MPNHLRCVDASDHARLAVRSLTAVEPLRLIIDDSVVKCDTRRRRLNGDEPGAESTFYGLTRIVEATFGDSMILWVKVKPDNCPDRLHDLAGHELQPAALANIDLYPAYPSHRSSVWGRSTCRSSFCCPLVGLKCIASFRAEDREPCP